MSKKQKTQTTQTQTQNQNYNNTNSYGWMTAPETADVQALRDFQFTADPRIGYTYGNARNQVANSFNNPLGGFYSPQMRDQVLRSSLSDLAQQESQAYSEANQGLQGQRYAQRSAIAALTSPRLVQTGSSGTGTSTGTGSGTNVASASLLPDLMAGAATGAAA